MESKNMLIEEIKDKLIYLGDGIIDASVLLNHQVDVDVLSRAAQHCVKQFSENQIDKILTLEVSGIVPALLAAKELGIPMVYARKGRRITQKECFEAPVKSRTTAHDTTITVDKRMLAKGERVLIVDDFLARGEAVAGIAAIVEQAEAELLGVYCVFEKTFEGGRDRLESLDVPVLSFIKLSISDDELLVELGEERLLQQI